MPTNDPISTSRRICPSVFTFYTSANWATGTPLKAATLTNVHLSFSFIGSQKPLQMGNLCIEVNQYYGGPTCLQGADAISASAINTAVYPTQAFVNSQDTGLPVNVITPQIKNFLLLRINSELQGQFSSCNSRYGAGANNPTSSMSFNIAYDVTPTCFLGYVSENNSDQKIHLSGWVSTLQRQPYRLLFCVSYCKFVF